jgi:hypothetical protein
MDRRRFLLTSLAGAVATPLAAETQQGGRLYSVGALTSAAGPSPTYGPIVSSALRDNGYQLGRNVVLETRYAAGRMEQHAGADPAARGISVRTVSDQEVCGRWDGAFVALGSSYSNIIIRAMRSSISPRIRGCRTTGVRFNSRMER